MTEGDRRNPTELTVRLHGWIIHCLNKKPRMSLLWVTCTRLVIHEKQAINEIRRGRGGGGGGGGGGGVGLGEGRESS